jgi:hypothetical protein
MEILDEYDLVGAQVLPEIIVRQKCREEERDDNTHDRERAEPEGFLLLFLLREHQLDDEEYREHDEEREEL